MKEIKVFADVGAANSYGAPTSFDAKKALGKNARVVAVDVLKLNQREIKRFSELWDVKVTPTDVEELLHAISRSPCPLRVMLFDLRQYQVICRMKKREEV